MNFTTWGLSQLNRCIQGILHYFGVFVESMGAWSFIFGIVVSMAVLRFLVYPFLKVGVAGSDSAKPSRTSKKDREEKK